MKKMMMVLVLLTSLYSVSLQSFTGPSARKHYEKNIDFIFEKHKKDMILKYTPRGKIHFIMRVFLKSLNKEGSCF